MSELRKLSMNALLHRLWTKAVGTKDYEKVEWQELERRIAALERRVLDGERRRRDRRRGKREEQE